MMRPLRPYSAYKDSGVEWMGKVPAHWDVRRVRTIASVVNGATPSSNVSSYWGGDIVWVTPQDLGALASRYVKTSARTITHDGYESCGATIVPAGSVAISTRAPIGHTAIFTAEACTNQGCRVLVPNDLIQADHLFYSLKVARPELESLGQGTTFSELSRDQLCGFPLSLPPLPEQAAIVRFLDHADRRIRRYIRAKQKLIALLEKQKQAIIHQAVTGQIDVRTGQSYPAYKPSGVEWLRDVPEHWETARLKVFLLRPMRNGLFKKKDAFGSGVPIVNVADIYHDSFQIDPASLDRVQTTPNELRTYQVRTGDLFFVRSSLKLEGTGRAAVAIDCEAGSVFECHLVQGRPDPRRAVARFLAFQLNSFSLRHYMISRANVVTMATVSQGVLASCPVFLPSISEQEGLLKQIDGECARVAATHDRAHREIDLLHEYRTRLIADVVTGKLDVRGAAARVPDEIEEANEFDALPEATETGVMEREDATELPEEPVMENEVII